MTPLPMILCDFIAYDDDVIAGDDITASDGGAALPYTYNNSRMAGRIL
jgi:hypothetical protein